MKIKNYYIVLLFFIVFTACEKEKDIVKETHPVKYMFINNGDSIISTVVLYCTTYYPDEVMSLFVSKGKWRPPVWDTEDSELLDFDSICVTPNTNAYIGCYYNFSITVWQFDSLGIERKKKYYKIDTIRNIADYNVKSTWPSDTVNYTVLE